MLSYAKHGKFPALTQAAQVESRRKKHRFRSNDIAAPLFRPCSGSWDGTDCKCAASISSGPEDIWANGAVGAALRRLKKQRRTDRAAVTPRLSRECSPR
jgi:hypothetical protein